MKINVEKQNVKEWLDVLDGASKEEHYRNLWKRLRTLVAVPARRRASVNLYKLDRHSKAGDNVVVPGKVLSTGTLGHSLNIAAIEFSAGALKALKESGCKVMGINEMLKEEKVRIII
jgi:large subunit ribosomal protein L18e